MGHRIKMLTPTPKVIDVSLRMGGVVFSVFSSTYLKALVGKKKTFYNI